MHNPTKQTLLLQSLKIGASEELLNIVVDAGETVELHPEEEFAQAELHVRVVRELDMIVPRTRCMVRHRAERYEPEFLPEIIFDLGVMLTGSSLTDARERRLRARFARTLVRQWQRLISAQFWFKSRTLPKLKSG